MAAETETFTGSGELHTGSGYDLPWAKGGADPGDALLEGTTDVDGETGVNASVDTGSGASFYTGSEQGTDAIAIGRMTFDRTKLAVCAKLQDADNYAAFHLDGTGSIGLRLEVREGGVEDDGDVRTQGAADLWVKLEAVSSGNLELFTGGTGASPSWGSLGSHSTQHFGAEGTQGLKVDAGTQVATNTNHYHEITFDSIGGGGTTVTVGLATETDTAFGLTASKAASVGQAAESDTAQPITASRAASVGLASETDSAFGVTASRAATVGQPQETDTAQPLTASRAASVGLATETDTAFGVATSGETVVPVGIAGETDSAFGVSASRSASVAQAQETDSAFGVTASKAATVGQVVESDTAFAVTAARAATVGQATEDDTAYTVTARKALAVGQPIEVDSAFALTAARSSMVGLALETDTALGLITEVVIISVRPGDGPNTTQLITGAANKTELIGGPNTTELQ